MSASRTKDLNITEGPLLKKIILFAIPLILTGLLQQFYNAADLMVVGMFEGEIALAAVGATGSLTSLMTALFMGLSVGAGVSVAHHIGEGNEHGVKRVVHTAIPVAVILGVAVGTVGIIFAPELLRMMDNPENVIEQSTLYIRIIFLGLPASMLYNYSAAMLRSDGDAKHPLVFLLISGFVNVILNFILVTAFHMGVAGVAIATITSQYLSAIMVIVFMMRKNDSMRFSFKSLCIDAQKLKKILYIGVPSGMQTCLFSLGNVMIQSSINSLGDTVMAGNAAATNLDGFVHIAMVAIYHVSITFVGQAVGAKVYRRIKTIVGYCVAVVSVIGITLSAIILIFNRQLIGLYAPDNEEVYREALKRMLIILPLYFTCGIMDVLSAALRAMGKSFTAMIITLIGACGVRVFIAKVVFNFYRTSECIYISFPLSYCITTVCNVIFLTVLVKKAIKETEQNTVPNKLESEGV